jgi:hypothetical protein
MINASALRSSLQQRIDAIRQAGWSIDSRLLQNDLDRSGCFLPELLMTQDSIEEFAESIGA